MTTTQGAVFNHPVAALIVGLVWLVAAVVFAFILAGMYACYGIVVGAQWGYGRWAGRYRGSHRDAA
jgi:hypothetical protein